MLKLVCGLEPWVSGWTCSFRDATNVETALDTYSLDQPGMGRHAVPLALSFGAMGARVLAVPLRDPWEITESG